MFMLSKIISITFCHSCNVFSAKCYLTKYNSTFSTLDNNIYNEVMQKLTLLK